jgi:hypothetical protein
MMSYWQAISGPPIHFVEVQLASGRRNCLHRVIEITISYNFFIWQVYQLTVSYYMWSRWLIEIPANLDTNRPS